jgi:carbonic anhydrase
MQLKHLLENNRRWSQEMTRRDPTFFKRLVDQQSPKYLWIGCSDSRVPANEIVGLLPGELFVHRNVANLVVHTDLNCLSVLQYAVDVLKVEHVIVCGHYGCGGVQAVIEKREVGLANNWLRHLADVAERHAAELAALPNDTERGRRLCELNVVDQVRNVCESTIVLNAWKEGRPLLVHGWVYGLQDGLLRDLLRTPVASLSDSLKL